MNACLTPTCGQSEERYEMRVIVLLMMFLVIGCSKPETAKEFDQQLQEAYWNRPDQLDPAYAIIKSGLGGDAWLATVHGFPDNRAVCMELIEPYQNDPSRSALPGKYTCRVLYDAPGAWSVR